MKHSNIAFFIPHLGCPHLCSFCDQRSISGNTAPPSPEEIANTCRQAMEQIPPERRQNTEIAFFGGSFTAIERGYMLALLQVAAPFCGEDRFAGIRISTRPDCISAEVLEILREHRVSVIELGVQSLDDEVLRQNRRGHTAAQVNEAVKLIRAYGFSLGLQMMTGLYGESKESVYNTAERIIGYQPDTVRIYPTVVIKGTELCRLYEAGLYHPPGVEETIPLAAELMLRFEQAGIRVIRVGLHPSRELERDMVAGAYHPAFRELCEGEIYYRALSEKLERLGLREVEVTVHPRAISKLVGHSGRNLRRLTENGYRIRLLRDAALPEKELIVKEVRESERKDIKSI